MDLEPSEHEPEEYDPEADLYDPNSDSLTIPQVTGDETNADPQLVTMFWAIVLVTKAAVIAFSVGLLLLLFDVNTRYGTVLVVGGLVLAGFAIYRYQSFDPAAVSTADEPDETDETDETDDVDHSSGDDTTSTPRS